MSEVLTKRILVSIIVPTFDEARYIKDTIGSILEQRTDGFDIEVLIVDGKSADGTPQIVSALTVKDKRVRLLANDNRTTPYALNIGLREARGQYVCIFGAHTKYTENYVSVCLNELNSRRAVACGGRVMTQPANDSLQARLVAWALAHPFGTSQKSFRTQQEGFADTVNYPVMVKQALLDAGGYDETLMRNEDNDMSQRLRAAGHRLFCTWKTQCFYYPVPNIQSLLRYAFRNGFWNAVSFRRNPSSMTLRYFVPLLFVITLVCLSLLWMASWLWAWTDKCLFSFATALLLSVYLGVSLLASIHLAARNRSLTALCLPLLFFSFHFSYGAGTLFAVLTNAKPGSAR